MSTKILVFYHKPAPLIKDEVFTPIHLGRVLVKEESKDGTMNPTEYQWMLNNMIGDDTGDNISNLNRRFCELTGIYWAWKNYDKLGNPSHIGFMHYRRHLSFNEKQNFYLNPKDAVWINHETLSENYIISHKLKGEFVDKFVENYDLLTTKAFSHNPVQHFQTANKYLHIEDYNEAMSIMENKFPFMKDAIKKYNTGVKSYFCNLIIMKKEDFFQYAKILFDVLFELDKKINYETYSIQEIRSVAYISEWMTGIYITYMYMKNKKIKELFMTCVKNSDINILPEPCSSDKKNIVFAADGKYEDALLVSITSLIHSSLSKRKYSIYILDGGVSFKVKKYLQSLANNTENIQITFFNMKKYLTKYSALNLRNKGYLTEASYYKIFIPEIFKDFKEVLYFDSDIIVTKDFCSIFDENISGYIAIAISDMDIIVRRNSIFNSYVKEYLNMNDIFQYINTGVILFNIKECIIKNFTHQCLDFLRKKTKTHFGAQCAINSLFSDNIKHIDIRYNYQWDIQDRNFDFMGSLPDRFLSDYQKEDEAMIIHYTSPCKPWKSPNCHLAVKWWQYARMTPFYEEILYKNISQNSVSPVSSVSKEMLTEIFNYTKNRIKYWRYKLLSKITFGKKRKEYKQKRKDMKARLKAVKRFLKGK